MNLENEEWRRVFKEERTRAERAEQKLLVARQTWLDVVPALMTALTAVDAALAAASDAVRATERLPSVDIALVEEVTK